MRESCDDESAHDASEGCTATDQPDLGSPSVEVVGHERDEHDVERPERQIDDALHTQHRHQLAGLLNDAEPRTDRRVDDIAVVGTVTVIHG